MHVLLLLTFRNRIRDRGFTELAAAMAASVKVDIQEAVKARSTIRRTRKFIQVFKIFVVFSNLTVKMQNKNAFV